MNWGYTMFLHNDKEIFNDLITLTANDTGLIKAIVEKDYYVTLFLKKISQIQPDIIFKGGTSLSKCYKIINRFSEDIDLNVKFEDKVTQGRRKMLKAAVVQAADEAGLKITNLDETKSRRDFNKYEMEYSTVYKSDFLKQNLICETAVFFKAYPVERLEADSFIYRYLEKTDRLDIAREYGLTPFVLNVQSAERTLIDKLFALGDYRLSGNIKGHSRHIYDIVCLMKIVAVDENLGILLNAVREERKLHKSCLSSQDGVNLPELLRKTVTDEDFINDYNKITLPLLFEKLSYEEAISEFNKLLDSGVIK